MISFIADSQHSLLLFSGIYECCKRAGIPAHVVYTKEHSNIESIINILPTEGCIVLWNGMTENLLKIRNFANANMMRVAFCEHGVVPFTTAIDPLGINARSSIANIGAEFLNKLYVPENLANELQGLKLNQRQISYSTEEIITDDDGPLPERFIILVLQVHDDTQIKFLSNGFSNIGELIDNVSLATQELGIGLIVKAHPSDANRVDYLDRIRKFEHVQYRLTNSLEYLLSYCSGVVTVNSGAGIDSMLRNTQVLTLGEASYKNISPIRYNGDMVGSIDELIQAEGITKLQKRWIYYMVYHYLIPVYSFNPNEDGCYMAFKRIMQIAEGKMPWLTDVPYDAYSNCSTS